MERDAAFSIPVDHDTEPMTVRSDVCTFVPKSRPPLTPDELEADRELCEMLGITADTLTDAEYQELRKIWE